MILQHCQLEENPSRLLFLKKLMVVTYFTSYLLFLEIYCNSYIFILSAVLYLTLPGLDYTSVVFVIIVPFNDRHKKVPAYCFMVWNSSVLHNFRSQSMKVESYPKPRQKARFIFVK